MALQALEEVGGVHTFQERPVVTWIWKHRFSLVTGVAGSLLSTTIAFQRLVHSLSAFPGESEGVLSHGTGPIMIASFFVVFVAGCSIYIGRTLDESCG